MIKVTSDVTVKLEIIGLPAKVGDSAPNSGKAMISDNGRKRDRTAVKMEDTQIIKRQKILKDPRHFILHDGFPRDFSELEKGEMKNQVPRYFLKIFKRI